MEGAVVESPRRRMTEEVNSKSEQDPILAVVPGVERSGREVLQMSTPIDSSSEPSLTSRIEAANKRVIDGAASVVNTGIERLDRIGPVGRIFDRVRMLRDRLETADIDSAVMRADARHNKINIKAEQARIELEEAERSLKEKETLLSALGGGVSEKALTTLREEIEKKRERHTLLSSKASEKKERLGRIRDLQRDHETRANAVIDRVNSPVNKKLAANQAESLILQTTEREMVDRLKLLQIEYEALQKINEETAHKWRLEKRGRVKNDLEAAGRLAAMQAQLKADQILRLERKLDKTRGRIWDLKDVSKVLEKKKVPLLGVSRLDDSLDPITGQKKKKKVEKRPLRLRPPVRRPVGME